MKEIVIIAKKKDGISERELADALIQSVEDRKEGLKRVLLLPPDITRMHSGGGKIAALYYKMLKDICEVDIMPALGTHDPMTEEECKEFFGEDIPMGSIVPHRWRQDIVKIGQVPKEFVSEVSGGLVDFPIGVEVNKRIAEGSYDLIISIGQVVPHEVVGMANYSKNIFVGCGGKEIINKSHFLGAVCGMEKAMGRDHFAVRKVFDYADQHFLKDTPLMYVLTVTTVEEGDINLEGLYIGRSRKLFEMAVELSQNKNLTFVDKPLEKVVVNLDEREFKSTWIGNKAVYRTRMAIADGGQLIILAPGVRKFGEDESIDRLIRKYGYRGRDRILEKYRENLDLQENMSAAAHLIHGSSDSRFSVTYCVRHMSRNEIEGAGFGYMDYEEAAKLYNPEVLKDGFNVLPDGEEIFYISNPAIGLWADKKRFC
ncbi:MAG: lactate racemase domain-containing protein [Clostridia bacterium]|nr:lactate racemase domain-containing protein [Clostridia bacterium]